MTLPEPRRLRGNRCTLSCRETGNGPALVLVHGLGGSSETWAAQYPAFADRYRVLAWDMPGYPGSDSLAADVPVAADYASELAGLLDRLGIARAHVVGHSIGAIIGASLAILDPGRIASFIFCHGLLGTGNAAPAEREAAKKPRIDALLSLGPERFAAERGPAVLGRAAAPEIITRQVAAMARVPVRGYCQAVEMMTAADIRPALGTLGAPALVIAGAEDKVSPEAVAREAAALLRCESVVLPGVGHNGPLEAPEAFNRALAAFLAKLG